MAGILDKKTRFMDTFLTQVGRSQLAHGELSFNFATFSDSCTFYEPSINDPSVVAPADNRLMFECANRPQDQVIPEFDADGAVSFPAGDFDMEGGALVLVGSGSLGKQLYGADLMASASSALTDCSDSFAAMMPLRTEERGIGGDSGFALSKTSHTFQITPGTLAPGKPRRVQVENLEPLWEDKKLTQVPNFQFLPPVSKVSGNVIANLPRLQQPAPLSFGQLIRGFTPQQRQPLEVNFRETSLNNNMVCQVWEITSSSMEKLRLIDFGEFEDEDPDSPGKHCFFVGKLYSTDESQPTFVNLFTVVLD